MAKSHHAAGACSGWRGGGWQRRELATRRPLRACVGGQCGRLARAAGVAQRSACIDGTACVAGLGGASGWPAGPVFGALSLPDNLSRNRNCYPCSYSSYGFTFRSCSGVPVRGADGILQELTPLGLVGVSSWRPWWVGTPLLSPPMTVRSEGSIVPSGLWISSCSKVCPWRQDGCRACALWEGLDRSWFVTTCFLAYGTCVCRRCTLLGYSG